MRLVTLAERLARATDYVSVQTLADELGVSVRTIQGDLARLRASAADWGFDLQSRRGLGVRVRVGDENRFRTYLRTLSQGATVSAQNLPDAILQVLATSQGYLSAASVAQRLQVSRTVVASAMGNVDELAQDAGLAVEKRPHLGMRVSGSRAALVDYLARRYCDATDMPIVHDAVDVVTSASQEGMDREVKRLLAAMAASVNYPEFLRLCAYVRVVAYLACVQTSASALQAQAGPAAQAPGTSADSHALVQGVAQTIRDLMGVDPGPEELAALAAEADRLLAPSAQTDLSLRGELACEIGAFLTSYDRRNGTTYMQDSAFRTMFLSHISLLISRLTRNVAYESFSGEEFVITNPTDADLALQVCQMLQRKFGVEVTREEVSLVAIHLAAHNERVRQNRLRDFARVAVVCSTGAGGAYLAQLQLEQLFPVADVRSFSYLDLDDMRAFSPDLVLSMVPLDASVQAPVIPIGEVLSEGDLASINELVRYGDLTDTEQLARMHDAIGIRPELFRRVAPSARMARYTDVVRAMAADLEARGYAQPGFGDLVLAREQYASTVYLNGVCIPHPLETDALQDAVSVCVVEPGMRHGDKDVRLVFMICLRKEHMELYRPISRRLYALMRDRAAVERLCDAQDGGEFLRMYLELAGKGKDLDD